MEFTQAMLYNHRRDSSLSLNERHTNYIMNERRMIN